MFTKDTFEPELMVSSPGRINFMGGHTDYNNGFVLPTAIDKKIKFSFRKNKSDSTCNFYTKDYDKSFTVNLNNISPSKENWENYILGVLDQLQQRSEKIKGFDCIFESELAIGSGLSSSAALECGIAYGINELFNLGISKKDIVILCRDAEHKYVGTKCGLMDQYASVFSETDKVLFLDCQSMQHTMINMHLSDYKILILNTNVSHNLSTSEYNIRREQCEKGVSIIRKTYPSVLSLRDVTLEMLTTVKTQLPTVIFERCQYILEENKRVLDAVTYLKNNKIKEFASLLYLCHEGLRHKYEVSCPELDFLVNYSLNKEYVLGSRMMGGGFGGCTINIIKKNHIDNYINEVSIAYKNRFDIELKAFQANPSKGTSHSIS
ncbi:galactokinase [Aquimarina sp. AU474]|uniref:galactokinase n=1 Tax=Aquimarina sp. AU474 TaxID=2108529 RepID=UPI000D69AA46|nr:galactokinase [Aquimarina sp. AU474]